MSESKPYPINPTYDPDLVGLDAERLEIALGVVCACGHARRDHLAATGALGSFGGTACECCWTCGTFRPTTPEEVDPKHVAWLDRWFAAAFSYRTQGGGQ